MKSAMLHSGDMPSLQQAMQLVSQRLDGPAHGPASRSPWATDTAPRPDGSLMDAAIQIDPVLEQLERERRDAATQCEQLKRSNGADDPMTEIACDMLESIEAAMEARRLHIMDDEEVAAEIRALKDAEDELYEEAKRRRLLDEERQRQAYFGMMHDMQVKARDGNRGGFEWLLLFWLLTQPNYGAMVNPWLPPATRPYGTPAAMSA